MKINLRDFYPFYETDEVIEVSEDVYNALHSWKLEDAAYLRRLFRNKAHYSLNVEDCIERKALCCSRPPYEIIADQLVKRQLYAAIASLPGKQAKRLYAYFFLDMSEHDIAEVENVCQQAVNESILRALSTLKEKLKYLL